jgi:hypothetical protein
LICAVKTGVHETSGNATASFALIYSIAYPLATWASLIAVLAAAASLVPEFFAAGGGNAVVRSARQQKPPRARPPQLRPYEQIFWLI